MKKRVDVVPLEHHEQCTVAAYLDLRRYIWFHCPNSTDMTHSIGLRMKIKRSGVKVGVPDIWVFPAKWNNCMEAVKMPLMRPVVIELKRVKGGTVSPEQKQWIAALQAIGFRAEICRGADAALAVLKQEGY